MNTDYFKSRATVRAFSDQEVSETLLDSILTSAMKAPTMGNIQLYSVIETRDAAMRERLAPQHFRQPAAVGAPVLLTICADARRYTRWCETSGTDAGFDNFLSFMNAATDALIYAQQVTTIAESEGLGVCWLGTVLYNAPEIDEILQLPQQVVPVACLAVGWPAAPGAPTERLELNTVRHRETYRPDTDADIVSQHRVKEEYPANQGFVAENQKHNLAQVIAEVRYPRAMNEDFSRKLYAYIKSKGFM